MITFSWSITPEQVWPDISRRQVKAIVTAIVKLIEGMAPDVEAWMKANHPWKNDTTAAEQGLYAKGVYTPEQFAGLMMSHGDDVPHAIWLEVAHRGKFSILAPALDHFAPLLLKEARAIVRRYSS